MKIIKRNGAEVQFDPSKISVAIGKANNAINEKNRISDAKIAAITAAVVVKCNALTHTPSVEEVQDMVELELHNSGSFEISKEYITYRYKRNMVRNHNTTDDKILSLIDCNNEEVKQENSNKNPAINAVQRDYMAGEISKDLTTRILLPKDVVEAHNEGIIHFHDSDYYAQRMHNCLSFGTRFMTNAGIKSFKDFNDGDTVFVYDMYGNEREATVHCFGIQKLQEVQLTNGINTVKIECTENHRWILKNGEVTTSLAVGDVLFQSPKTMKTFATTKSGKLLPCTIESPEETRTWWVEYITRLDKEEPVYCVTEPITHTFMLEYGIVTGNCDLINLDDMLQNGTVISGTMIEKPHSFSTACNIATQIIAQVASNQYGGQSISLTHLAPFVDISRKKIRKQVEKEYKESNHIVYGGELIELSDAANRAIDKITEDRLRDEVKRGVQTIQYQVVTLMTTNGQAPFITVFMYLNEARNEQEKKDLALIIEETLEQRYQGVKNEAGVWISPAFPKLVYVLEDDNTYPGSEYYYLTKIAAKCTAKRLVPDYISEKKMKEYKLSKGETEGNGDVYTPMGCRSFLTPDRSGNGFDNIARAKNYEPNKPKYYGRLTNAKIKAS